MKNTVKDEGLILYFEFVSFVLLLTGFTLFFYCMFKHINPWSLDVLSSPVNYLVLGTVCLIVFFVTKYK